MYRLVSCNFVFWFSRGFWSFWSKTKKTSRKQKRKLQGPCWYKLMTVQTDDWGSACFLAKQQLCYHHYVELSTGMKAYHLGVPGRNARLVWPLTCSEVFMGHAANNGLRIFMRKHNTRPPRPFVRPASDLIKGLIRPPHQVFECWQACLQSSLSRLAWHFDLASRAWLASVTASRYS